MAHVIPTLNSALRAMHTLPATRRTNNPDRGEASAAADFRTVLKQEAAPAAAKPCSTAAPTATVGTVGTVTPWTSPAVVNAPAAPATTWKMAPTAESLFGPKPWVSNAGGTGPTGDYGYNCRYFATPATAAKVAEILGGTVVKLDAITPSGPFKQNQPNLMIQMPNGKLINAGLVAGFYDHGCTQQAVDEMIAGEINGELG